MQEIYRVLVPGGVCIVTFSNRQFYNKVWQCPGEAVVGVLHLIDAGKQVEERKIGKKEGL